MKQNSNRRSRSRGSNKKPQGKNNYDSNGPAGRVRGTAQQVLEKYQMLGRDAASSGDWIVAESCLQYAEHYYRIVHSENEVNGKSMQAQGIRGERESQMGGSPIATEIPIVEPAIADMEIEKVSDIKGSTRRVPEPLSGVEGDKSVSKNNDQEKAESVGARRRRPRIKQDNSPSISDMSDS